MSIARSQIDPNAPAVPSSLFDRILHGMQLAAVAWLLFTGMWSGPSLGATLAYPHGFMAVEAGLALILVVQGWRGRIRSPRAYPFLRPSLAVLILCAVSAACRVMLNGTAPGAEALRVWQHGEPMLRGLLLFLAIAGQPGIFRAAWLSLLAGMLLHAGAAIIQHVTNVSRWFANPDEGWADGWQLITTPAKVRYGVTLAPRVYGLTSYINLSAALFAAYIPFWWTLPALRLPRASWGRLLLVAGGMAMTAALWYTGSRGPMLAVIAGGLFLFWHLSKNNRTSLLVGILAFFVTVLPATPWWALSAFAVAIGLAVVVKRKHLRYLIPVAIGFGLAGGLQVFDAYFLNYRLAWRMTESAFAGDSRTILYRDAVEAITVAPWWGIGDAAAAQRITTTANGTFRKLLAVQRNYHNQVLHWAAAEGIVVAAAFAFLVCWATWWCWQHCRRRPDPFQRAAGLCCALGATIFLFCNITEAHFWRIEGGGFFWSLLALGAAAGNRLDRCTAIDQPTQEPADEVGGGRG